MKKNSMISGADELAGLPTLQPNSWGVLFVTLYLFLMIGSWGYVRICGGELSAVSRFSFGLFVFPAAVLLVALGAMRRVGTDFKASLADWRKNFFTDLVIGSLYFIPALLLAWALTFIGQERLLQNPRTEEIDALLLAKPYLKFPMALSLVVVAPLGEEIFFKRLLYTGLRRKMPAWRAVALCTLLFTLIHQRAQLIPMLIFVPITYYMYERHRRLQANVIVHALINLVAIWCKLV